MTVRPGAVVGWAFISFILATGPLAASVADQSMSTYLSAGALGALGLVGGTYAAEIARARVLRRRSLPVQGVQLGAFGGRLVGAAPPEDPRVLTRFAWAGPLALLACAVLAAGVAAGFATGSGSAPRLLATAAVWVSALLGLFGLAELLPRPGAPGGYLVAARAWRRTGRRSDGELAVAKAGIRSGWALGVVAVAATLFVSPLAIWLLPLAALTVVASRAAVAGATLRRSVSMLAVRDVMSPPLPETRAWSTIDDALESLSTDGPARAAGLLVRDVDADWAGVVPLPLLLAVPGDDRDTTRIRQCMVPRAAVATVRVDATLETALDALTERPAAGMVLVLGDGSPAAGDPSVDEAPARDVVGVLTAFDIARAAHDQSPGSVRMPMVPGWPAP